MRGIVHCCKLIATFSSKINSHQGQMFSYIESRIKMAARLLSNPYQQAHTNL